MADEQTKTSEAKATKKAKAAPEAGISDNDCWAAWLGKAVEVHLTSGGVIRAALVGYGPYTLTLMIDRRRLLLLQKGAIAWAAQDSASEGTVA